LCPYLASVPYVNAKWWRGSWTSGPFQAYAAAERTIDYENIRRDEHREDIGPVEAAWKQSGLRVSSNKLPTKLLVTRGKDTSYACMPSPHSRALANSSAGRQRGGALYLRIREWVAVRIRPTGIRHSDGVLIITEGMLDFKLEDQ
jgi:hypothetical protein